MSTMPPISCSRSAPRTTVSSPAASRAASHARRSWFGAARLSPAAAPARGPGSMVVCILLLTLLPAVDDVLEPLRRDRQLGEGSGDSDRILDGRSDRGADRGDAALACALDAERVQRARRLLRQDDFDVGRLAHRRQEVVRERRAERVAPLIVDEFLQQRAAYALREPADDLPLDQR